MKRIFCILLSLMMLLSLAACGAREAEPTLSPEEQAFEAACALLEEGKYQEAYDAFNALESYRKVQVMIDQALHGMELERLAAEEAERQAQLEKVGFLYGTTWHELGGTAELTFEEHQNGGSLAHYRYWEDRETQEAFDVHWKFIDGEIWISYFPGLDPDTSGEYGYRATAEERDGITHLLVDGLDFVRSEDYGPYAPVEIEVTMDNWQEYFEIREGYEWLYDDFGVCNDVRIHIAMCLKEVYQDRAVFERTSVKFGYTFDSIFRNIDRLDFENCVVQLGVTRQVSETDVPDTFDFGGRPYYSGDLSVNDTIPELPRVLSILRTGLYISLGDPPFFSVYEDFSIDRVAGTLVLIPE